MADDNGNVVSLTPRPAVITRWEKGCRITLTYLPDEDQWEYAVRYKVPRVEYGKKSTRELAMTAARRVVSKLTKKGIADGG